jgi:hypothetical protein
MLRFIQFIKEMVNEVDWSYGHPAGSSVQVNNPSHADHGKTGRVIRQLGHEHGVDIGGKLSWHRTDQLKPVKPVEEQEVPAGKMGQYHEDFNDDVPVNPRTTKPKLASAKDIEKMAQSLNNHPNSGLKPIKKVSEMKLVPSGDLKKKPLLRPNDHGDKDKPKYFVHPHLNPDPKHNVDEGIASIGPNMFVKTGKTQGKSKTPYFFPKLAPAKPKPEQITPVLPSAALKSEDISGNVQRQIDPQEGKHSGRNAGRVRLTPHNPNQQRDGWPS